MRVKNTTNIPDKLIREITRGRFSEIDTESYAINKLRQWRNKNNL